MHHGQQIIIKIFSDEVYFDLVKTMMMILIIHCLSTQMKLFEAYVVKYSNSRNIIRTTSRNRVNERYFVLATTHFKYSTNTVCDL